MSVVEISSPLTGATPSKPKTMSTACLARAWSLCVMVPCRSGDRCPWPGDKCPWPGDSVALRLGVVSALRGGEDRGDPSYAAGSNPGCDADVRVLRAATAQAAARKRSSRGNTGSPKLCLIASSTRAALSPKSQQMETPTSFTPVPSSKAPFSKDSASAEPSKRGAPLQSATKSPIVVASSMASKRRRCSTAWQREKSHVAK
mmetsp:Transcript_84491/g.171330  ORF Transcript_84491/g.171330 Transcript_84491/m.171330 type:complete len:202 (-) Transcript_84491:817-1422(-)